MHWLLAARGSEVATADTPNLLSCLDERHIWISWASGYLQVGHSSLYGINQLLSWADPNPLTISLMHFYSRAIDLNCRWNIFYNSG